MSWKGVIPDTEMVPEERYSESSAGQTKSLETKVWQATANSTTVYKQQLENDLAVYVQQTEDIFTPNIGNHLQVHRDEIHESKDAAHLYAGPLSYSHMESSTADPGLAPQPAITGCSSEKISKPSSSSPQNSAGITPVLSYCAVPGQAHEHKAVSTPQNRKNNNYVHAVAACPDKPVCPTNLIKVEIKDSSLVSLDLPQVEIINEETSVPTMPAEAVDVPTQDSYVVAER